MDLLHFIGRFHLLLLHLPIGLVFAVVLLECLTLVRRRHTSESHRLHAVLSAFFAGSAIVAATTGFLLSRTDEVIGLSFDLHMWLGIAAAGVSLLYALIVRTDHPKKTSLSQRFILFRRLVLLLVFGLITTAGHFGGQLVHGKNFITAYAPEPLKRLLGMTGGLESQDLTVNQENAGLYEQIIQPILQSRCTMCHGEQKRKAKLALHTPEAIARGGASGPIWTPGEPIESPLVQRITLPPDHDDHMPPAEKSQLSPPQIAALTWWIEQGADFDMKADPKTLPAQIAALLPTLSQTETLPNQNKPKAKLDLALIRQLQDRHIAIQRIEASSDLLWVECSAIASQVTDQTIQDLSPLAAHIAWLDLSQTAITPAALPLLAQMSELTTLNLHQTNIDTDSLVHLHDLKKLTKLNLSGVPLSDKAVDILLAMPSLQRVYLWNTGLSPAALKTLQAPRVEVITDVTEADIIANLPPTETERETSSDAGKEEKASKE